MPCLSWCALLTGSTAAIGQDTPEDLGPTEILPCTQYFHNDSSPEHGYPTAGRTIGAGVSNEPDFAQRDANRAAVLKQVGWPLLTRVVAPRVTKASGWCAHPSGSALESERANGSRRRWAEEEPGWTSGRSGLQCDFPRH